MKGKSIFKLVVFGAALLMVMGLNLASASAEKVLYVSGDPNELGVTTFNPVAALPTVPLDNIRADMALQQRRQSIAHLACLAALRSLYVRPPNAAHAALPAYSMRCIPGTGHSIC